MALFCWGVVGSAPPRLNSDNNCDKQFETKSAIIYKLKWLIPCSRRGVTGRQCTSVYTRDTPLLQKATGNYITKYYLMAHDIPLACYVTVNQSDSFNISCDLQPIRFLQHVMWPSTNQIPTACRDLQPITSLKHVMWPSTNQVQPHFYPQPQLIGLAVVLLAMRAAMKPRMKMKQRDHICFPTVPQSPCLQVFEEDCACSHTWTMRHPLLA